ncbi:arginase family protein [Phenylobacterium soli]|uniref:Arginase n=1 Tax=Phenylobacterium soli TaxID=2170551 RepID=A0A328AMX2_9CAUL|nr:arginase family protein [Phenylobacterium soli]RAK54774.1 arginase [Phenylobacterium soli]
MRPAILQLDDSLARQGSLERAVLARGGRVMSARDLGPALRLWTRRGTLGELRGRILDGLPARGEAEVVFAGSGDFHHVTPLLLERAVAMAGEPVTVLHFDNHPDWVRFAQGLHCGSWVGQAARMDGVDRVVTVGVCSPDIGRRKAHEGDLELIWENKLDVFAWTAPDGRAEVTLEGRSWPTIESLGEAAFLDRLDAAIATRSVYVTLDKDVLRAEDAVTNWDQGRASLEFVAAAVRSVSRGRRIVGADVVGDWSKPDYGLGLGGLMKRGEAMLDQPWSRPRPDEADRLNEAVNLRLLEVFTELRR